MLMRRRSEESKGCSKARQAAKIVSAIVNVTPDPEQILIAPLMAGKALNSGQALIRSRSEAASVSSTSVPTHRASVPCAVPIVDEIWLSETSGSTQTRRSHIQNSELLSHLPTVAFIALLACTNNSNPSCGHSQTDHSKLSSRLHRQSLRPLCRTLRPHRPQELPLAHLSISTSPPPPTLTTHNSPRLLLRPLLPRRHLLMTLTIPQRRLPSSAAPTSMPLAFILSPASAKKRSSISTSLTTNPTNSKAHVRRCPVEGGVMT